MNKTEYLLACLAEECSEVTKECTKALRFGLEYQDIPSPSGKPLNPKPPRERLADELNDILGLLDLMEHEGVLPPDWNDPVKREARVRKTERYMEYSRKLGALEHEEQNA